MEFEKGREGAQEDDKIVTCELEAAEALASMSWCSVVTGSGESDLPRQQILTESVPTSSDALEDRGTASQQFFGNASTLIAHPVNPEQNVETTTHQMCSTSYPSNSASKSRQKLTKADKEGQRCRRVLANRESARRTICRRQALYSEQTRKAAELSAENQHLRREMELAIKEYNSLKTRNGCLKVQMAKITKAETKEIQEESKSAQAEKSTSASRAPPVFFCNQPFAVPVFWPPIGPPSDVFRGRCASHTDAALSSQLPLQLRDMPCSHLEQDNSTSLNKTGAPVFVFPVPWPFPFVAQSSTLNSQPALKDRQNGNSPSCQCCMHSTSDTLVHAENHQLLPTVKKKPEASSSMQTISLGNIHGERFSVPPDDGGQQLVPQHKGAIHVSEPPSCTIQIASFRRSINAQVDESLDIKARSSAPEHMAQALPDDKKAIIWSNGKSKDNIASTEARKKRKELLKLKNLNGTSS
ncbi:Basic-leucine zipper (bZIP) transcription factor family protein [Forsythia ovata]|uniref:Basic-leucine zipper (BZIP) transcription factor family protein n=1 Tax=Forsythia ovata TaxID=205694 RepID=A0ABD1SQK8_9LAMI